MRRIWKVRSAGSLVNGQPALGREAAMPALRSALAAALFAVVATLGGASAQERSESVESADARLRSEKEALARIGLAEIAAVTAIQIGKTKLEDIELHAGTVYAIVGVCEKPCERIELTLLDRTGMVVFRTPEKSPVVVLTGMPNNAGRHVISLSAQGCGSKPCVGGLVIMGRATEQQTARPVAPDPMPAGRVFRDCPECPEMVVMPTGRFLRGSAAAQIAALKKEYPSYSRWFDREGPQHEVAIERSFAVGKFEVTFREWDACTADGGCKHKPSDDEWGRGRRPVVNVSWNDAKQYLAWLSRKTGNPYRLLTDAEWEYAARAGTTSQYSFGDSEEDAEYYAWFSENSRERTQQVGQLRVNVFGLHDMHGNVWEWVEDCLTASYKGARTDGTANTSEPCRSRVNRGGGWKDAATDIRAARRDGNLPTDRLNNLGFRVARTISP